MPSGPTTEDRVRYPATRTGWASVLVVGQVEPERQGVPGALEGLVACELDDLESRARRTRLRRRESRPAVSGWTEPARDEPVPVDDPGVGGEDEVRAARSRVEQLD